MTLSLWRYSHLALAITSTLFLIIASVTGVILSFEPISKSIKRYEVVPLDKVSLSQTIEVLTREYEEVLEIEVTGDNQVKASVISKDGVAFTNYINPITAEILGPVTEKSPLFKWTTNFHRSLFLKGIGRFFVGLVSFILCLIAVTGTFLLAQRQGGFNKWFSSIKDRDFHKRYHVILGRWFLIPIIIIAGTGVFLSAEKFEILPAATQSLDWNVAVDDTITGVNISEHPFFKETSLNKVRKVIFPFSNFPEDYYEVNLTNSDVLIHQYSGAIMSEVSHPFVQLATQWSLQWHTGEGSIVWSMVLLLASGSILFFVFSGITLLFKRRNKVSETVTMSPKDHARFIILVGSEGGDSYAFAKACLKALVHSGYSVFLTTLNEYTTYEKAEHFLIFTSTYGDGDAPTNARYFEEKFKNISQQNKIEFSILGFGSTHYPKFCEYAFKMDALLSQDVDFMPAIPLMTVDEQSQASKEAWVSRWSKHMDIPLEVNFKETVIKKKRFKVVGSTLINKDDTFLLRLKPLHTTIFYSGDLLEIIPPQHHKVRQYSIARIGEEILLSIKKHDRGVCSDYLSNLKTGAILKASIKINKNFHFPETAPKVLLISNGTGIAPFIGMISKNAIKTPIELYWGGRTKASFDIYRPILKEFTDYHTACSREANVTYVQDLIADNGLRISQELSVGAIVMICGSITMQGAVLLLLDKVVNEHLGIKITFFESNGQILTDCY